MGGSFAIIDTVVFSQVLNLIVNFVFPYGPLLIPHR